MNHGVLKYIIIISLLFSIHSVLAQKLTYGEVAVVVVQHSGLFDYDNTHIKIDILDDDHINSIDNEAVQFLNNLGIIFDPLYVSMKKRFTIKDMDRVLGQIYLLHNGRVDKDESNIKLPDGYISWNEFCKIHLLDPKVCLVGLEQAYRLLKLKEINENT